MSVTTKKEIDRLVACDALELLIEQLKPELYAIGVSEDALDDLHFEGSNELFETYGMGDNEHELGEPARLRIDARVCLLVAEVALMLRDSGAQLAAIAEEYARRAEEALLFSDALNTEGGLS